MKLGMPVGLVPGHTVLGWDRAPPPLKAHSLQFSAHICCGQMAAWIKMSLGVELGLGPGDYVLDGNQTMAKPWCFTNIGLPKTIVSYLWCFIVVILDNHG